MHLSLFLQHRPRLLALAYRMLGSRADAHDVVQDAWLRWSGCALDELETPAAYLTRLTTHLCLDWLKSARHRNEQYVGVRLPEPLLSGDECTGQECLVERAQLVSYGWLLAVQRLSVLERAAFLLHEVFDVEHVEVARVLQRSPQACRQLVSRAKRKLQDETAGHAVQPAEPEGMFQAFTMALQSGNTEVLSTMLAEEVLYMADGGGKARALPAPLFGRRAVVRLLVGIWREVIREGLTLHSVRLNGMPGLLAWRADELEMSVAIACDLSGKVRGVYAMRNPDKLTHLKHSSAGTGRPRTA